MDKNSVETSQDFFADRLKRSRKWDVGGDGENVFVVDLKVKLLILLLFIKLS